MFTFFLAQLQNHPGWFAINVLVPVLLPFVVIAAVAVATGGRSAFTLMLRKSVDQGQLFWVSLGMLASIGYEAFSAYGKCRTGADLSSWTLGLCILGTFFSSIFIALNTSRTSEGLRVQNEVVLISILMTLLISCCYLPLHILFTEC